MEDFSYMNPMNNMNPMNPMNGDVAGVWQDRNKKPMNIEGTKLFVGNLPFGTSDRELKEVFGAYGEIVDTMLLNSKATSGMHCAFVFFRDPHAAQTAIDVMHNNYRFGQSEEACSVQFARSSDSKHCYVAKNKGFGGKGFNKGPWGLPMAPGFQQPMFDPALAAAAMAPMMMMPGMMPVMPGMVAPMMAAPMPVATQPQATPAAPPKPIEEPDNGTKLFVGNLPCDIDEGAMQTVFGSYGKVQAIALMKAESGENSGQACAFVVYETEYEAKTAINTLHEKYEIRPGEGPISVRPATSKNKRGPY